MHHVKQSFVLVLGRNVGDKIQCRFGQLDRAERSIYIVEHCLNVATSTRQKFDKLWLGQHTIVEIVIYL